MHVFPTRRYCDRPEPPVGPGGKPDGRFTADWHYVSASGDLSMLNGRFAVTPEYPDGVYHYVATESFPHLPRGFAGTPDKSFRRLPGQGPNHVPDRGERLPLGDQKDQTKESAVPRTGRYAVRPMIPAFVQDELRELDIELTPGQLDQLDRYLALVLDENRTTNLTAVREADAAWRRLIIDSLTVLPGLDELEPGSRVIDVGSGAGLPGMPVAIARPSLKVTLLESTGKKADFIRRAIDTLGLTNATVLQDRAETIGQSPEHREQYDACINRAVGPMNVLLEFALPLVSVGGRVLAMKGPKVEEELGEAGDALSLLGAGELAVIEAYPESFGNDLVIVSIIKEVATPDEYPRLPGVPKKQPL